MENFIFYTWKIWHGLTAVKFQSFRLKRVETSTWKIYL